ncbi:MAG TPA: HEPN domain-containing protein [Bacteroidia bacterium]
MEDIYQDFCKDIEHLKSVLKLADSLKVYTGVENEPKIEFVGNEFLLSAEDVHIKSREANIGMAFIPGTIVLYLGGRFEFFIKTIFEELCINIAIKCKKFDYLPKEFKESLITQTSEVIKSPAKYGHGDNGRNTFITNLSNNINGIEITDINAKCLSITSENMRSQILADLFNRIGAKEIWMKLSQQAKLQVFFETADPSKAQKDASKFLNDFMDMRNKVAHPSGSFQWPDTNAVLYQINYFEMLGKVILELCSVYENHLVSPALEKIGQEVEKSKP